jgi:hypothetical protein
VQIHHYIGRHHRSSIHLALIINAITLNARG